MKLTHLFDTTSLVPFQPRTMCFAEADAADSGGVGQAPGPVVEAANDDMPEIDVEEPDNSSSDDEPDDLEEIEFEGRKARIPKGWKDPLEQGKDYRFKTGKLAEERRAIEAERARYTALVKETEATLKANQPARPDAAMLDRTSDKYDPDTYHMQRARWENWAQQAYNAEQERKRLEAEESTKAERVKAERKATSDREIIKAIPAWKDPAVKAADRVKMEAYSVQHGVSADEFPEIDSDHRLAAFVYKAMKYDEAVAKALARKDQPQTQITAAPVRKAGGGSSGSGKNTPPRNTEDYIKWRKNGGKM